MNEVNESINRSTKDKKSPAAEGFSFGGASTPAAIPATPATPAASLTAAATYIADNLAVGLYTGQIKTGAPCHSEFLAKYNPLL